MTAKEQLVANEAHIKKLSSKDKISNADKDTIRRLQIQNRHLRAHVIASTPKPARKSKAKGKSNA